MSRFVMVSFLFLGWTFYEMSGGAGFQPPERPQSIAKESARVTHQQQVTAASLVTHPVLQPHVARRTPILPDRPAADPNLRSTVALAQIGAIGDALGFGQDAFAVQPDGTSPQLASLASGLVSVQIPALIDQPTTSAVGLGTVQPVLASDLRRITASRANMRDGPGTIYPVLTSLPRHQEVEVLDDSGTGWLRLRATKNDQAGWIAASLVSKKNP